MNSGRSIIESSLTRKSNHGIIPRSVSYYYSMADGEKKLHIAMFPWLAFGHMIPNLELAKLIAQKGHRISFISTPRNIDRLPKLPSNLSSLINFVKIPITRVENLPENAEATIDVPFNKVQYLKKAYDGMEESLSTFLQSSEPDWIIHDFTSCWLPSIANKLGVPCAFFSIFIASSLCFVIAPTSDLMKVEDDDRTKPEDYTILPKWIPFPSNLAFRHFEITRIFDALQINDSGVSDMHRMRETMRLSDLIAVRSSSEFEPEWFNLLQKLHKTPVVPIGQLPPTPYDNSDDEISWPPLKLWLDKQKKGSVVYIAFGSEAKPSQDELTEIALGLEISELPFFWVLKTRHGSTDKEMIHLPEGFEDRTRDRGFVCTSWAPQVKILSHDSVGGFLTHSGWSSVVEAIQFERALILLPFLADQGLNVRILEEKKMGYSIPRNERDGSFTRNSVAQSLKLVMVDEEGEIYRDNVKKMKAVFGDRDIQDGYITKFLTYFYLLLHGRKIKDVKA